MGPGTLPIYKKTEKTQWIIFWMLSCPFPWSDCSPIGYRPGRPNSSVRECGWPFPLANPRSIPPWPTGSTKRTHGIRCQGNLSDSRRGPPGQRNPVETLEMGGRLLYVQFGGGGTERTARGIFIGKRNLDLAQ